MTLYELSLLTFQSRNKKIFLKIIKHYIIVIYDKCITNPNYKFFRCAIEVKKHPSAPTDTHVHDKSKEINLIYTQNILAVELTSP